MQKRTFLILLILIIFLGVVGFFLVSNQGTVPPIQVEDTEQPEFIPFTGTNLGGEEMGDGLASGNLGEPIPGRDSYSDFDAVDSNLIQISSEPVAGYTLFSKIFEITEDPKELVSDSLVETYNFFEFPSLKIGDSGEGVVALKTVLNRLFPEAALPTDGTFDTATKNSLIGFQTQHNLAADGIAGSGTKAKLNEVQGLSKNPKDFEPIVRQEERFTIRYQNKKNGYVYDFGIDDKNFEQVSKVPFSAVHESFFGNEGNSLIVRYISTNESIATYFGQFTKKDETISFDGNFLAPDIPFVSVSPDGKKMVFFEETSRRTRGYVLDLATKEKKTVFDSKFSEWLPEFSGPEIFTLTTRASALASGYSYKYKAGEKDSFEKGIGGFSGLTTKYNPSGSKVLYSTNNGGKFIETYVYDFNENTNLTLGIRTLAEKCIWIDNDNLFCSVPRFITPEDYPDAWYKGEVLFDERLWSVNTTNGLEKIVSTLRHPGILNVDAVNLVYKNGILLFQNKYDYTLWMLDLREE